MKLVPSGILTIDLSALRANYRRLCQEAAASSVGAVVKADAYGLGASRVAPIFYEAGCRDFFVAHLEEALVLVPALPADARLFVLGGLFKGTETVCADANIIPVLNSLDQIADWAALAKVRGDELPAVLQVDTGMSRLGLSNVELLTLLDKPSMLDGVRLHCLMSHLACADKSEHPRNTDQMNRLRSIAPQFPGVPVSLANSGGVFLGKAFTADLVRPGIALFGGAPHGGRSNPMNPVLRLDIRVLQMRDVPKGSLIGYGGTYTAREHMRLATIAAGYADGIPRALSNRGAAYFGRTRLPIVGRVSMDTTIVDVSDVDPGTIKPGTLVEIIGPSQSVDDLASAADTIAYEILTRLGSRYQRIYSPSPSA